MATGTDGVHSSVIAIQNMEVACARFARALVERLPEIERELSQAAEDLEDRRSDLGREIADLEDQISSADEADDVSWERRRVEEVGDELASVQRRIRSLSEAGSAYTKQAIEVDNLANFHSIRAREFLNGAADDLKAYLTTKNVGADQRGRDGQVPLTARVADRNATDYRSIFFAAHPHLRGQVVVHHAIELRALKFYPGIATEMELHSLKLLRGVPKDINGPLHLSLICSEWHRFYRENPTATKELLLEKVSEIDAKYGHNFWPPTGIKTNS